MLVSTVTPMGGLINNTYADEGVQPVSAKNIRNNGDGTHTISLNVKGSAKSETTTTGANVIVAFDTSGSMDTATGTNAYSERSYGRYGLVNGEYVQLYYWSTGWNRYREVGNNDNHSTVYYFVDDDSDPIEYTGTRYNQVAQDRLDVAKRALNSLAEKLLANNTASSPNAIEMAFIDFSTHVNSTNGKTNDLDTFKSWVAQTDSDGGTNWEDALTTANNFSFNDNDKTYVIFISDGNPTFRVSQNGYNDWNRWYQAYGTGNSDPNSRNFNAAKAVADAIVANPNKELFSVGVFGDATNMQNLGGTYKDATDQAALNAAFDDIVSKITNSLTLEDVTFTDGVTDMTSVAAVDGDVSSFKYFIKEKNDTAEREWTDAPHARYEDGHVIWEVGDLADGTEARVEFVVWPKQEAYDLVAALNNGEVTYDETTMGESIVNNGDGTYSLKTNKKDPKLSYTVVTKKTNAAGEVISEDRTPGETILTNPDPVGLTDYSFVISKQWEDILDTSQIEDIDSVELTLHRDDEVMENSIVLDKEHDWKLAKEIHIAPGVMINKNSETAAVINRSGEYNDKIVGDYIILEDGHDYWLEEKDIDYHFELTKFKYHPMLVDGVLKNVIFAEDGSIESIEDLDNEKGIYAENTVKGGINIEKKLNGVADEKNVDQKFEIKVELRDKNGDDLPMQSNGNNEFTYDYRVFYNNKISREENNCAEGATCRSEHKYGDSSSFTEEIRPGDVIRIVNVTGGTLFYVEEDQDMPIGYSQDGEIVYEIGTKTNASDTDPTYGAYSDDETQTLDGKKYYAVKPNYASRATVTNKYESTDLELTKEVVVVRGDNKDDKEFNFTIRLTDENGNELAGKYAYTVGNKTGEIASGEKLQLKNGEKAIIADLPVGAKYEITEDEANKDGFTTTSTGETGTFTEETAKVKFINTYEASKVKTNFVINKDFNDWNGDTFKFVLKDKDGNEIATADVTENTKSAEFEVEYETSGEYEYTVSEDTTGLKERGITNDPDILTVKVKVVDDGKGNLIITEGPTISSNATIKNVYESKGLLKFSARKILNGRNWLNEDRFTFDLFDASNGTEQKIGTVVLENGEIVDFDTVVTYTTDDRDKTFVYIIRENEAENGIKNGLTNQTGDVKITVKLTDDHQGNLTTNIENDTYLAEIENKYETNKTSAVLKVEKSIEDLTNSRRDGSFTFELRNEDGDVIQTKNIDTSNLSGSVDFNAIQYDQAGT